MRLVKYVQFIVDLSQLPDQKTAIKRKLQTKNQIIKQALLKIKKLTNKQLKSKIIKIKLY